MTESGWRAIPLCSLVLAVALAAVSAGAAEPPRPRPAAEIIKSAPPGDWERLDPGNLLVMTVKGQRVVILLAPRFAPEHVANIRALAREHYWDGLDVIRVQDGYVTQWGDPDEDSAPKPLGKAKPHLPAEFAAPAQGLALTRLPDPDGWAPVTGFAGAMPVALDPKQGNAWIPHCYGVVGAARGNPPDSSTGAGLYVVIGQSPRNLDLNITVVGRVVQGLEALTALPRGTGELGFYEKPDQYVPIESVRLAADLPESERPALEALRTDSASFKELIEAKRRPNSAWYAHSPGFTNVCNVAIPTRPAP